MSGPNDLLQPIDVVLLEHPADGETMDDAAVRLDAPARLDGVAFRLGVEVALLVVPVRVFPGGEVAAHLQVERDGDASFAFLHRSQRRNGAAEELTACERRDHGACSSKLSPQRTRRKRPAGL